MRPGGGEQPAAGMTSRTHSQQLAGRRDDFRNTASTASRQQAGSHKGHRSRTCMRPGGTIRPSRETPDWLPSHLRRSKRERERWSAGGALASLSMGGRMTRGMRWWTAVCGEVSRSSRKRTTLPRADATRYALHRWHRRGRCAGASAAPCGQEEDVSPRSRCTVLGARDTWQWTAVRPRASSRSARTPR